MGDDAQFETLAQVIKTSKSTKIGLVTRTNKFVQLAYLSA